MPPGHVFDFRMLYTLPHVEAIESSIPDAGAGLGTKKAFSEGEVVVHIITWSTRQQSVESSTPLLGLAGRRTAPHQRPTGAPARTGRAMHALMPQLASR